MAKLIIVLILSLSGVTTVAYFAPPTFWGGPGHGGGSVSAPEIDPASAVTALTLLLGGVTVLRARKSR
ncbi:MAG TPA: hypothetical protein VGI65_15965 [Steroidobacteraceae bacterium]|jgi:hypothetical protein